MEQVLKLAEDFLIQRVIGNNSPLSSPMQTSTIIRTVIASFSLIGIGLCLAGLHMWLLTIMPVYGAMLITGGAFIALSLLFVVGTLIYTRAKAQKIKEFQESIKHDIENTLKAFGDEIFNAEIIQENPKTACAIAISFGCMLGNIVSCQTKNNCS